MKRLENRQRKIGHSYGERLFFAENYLEERVQAVVHYKKPTIWVSVVSVLLCVALAACAVLGPKVAAPGDPAFTLKKPTRDGQAVSALVEGLYFGMPFEQLEQVMDVSRGQVTKNSNGILYRERPTERDREYRFYGQSVKEIALSFYLPVEYNGVSFAGGLSQVEIILEYTDEAGFTEMKQDFIAAYGQVRGQYCEPFLQQFPTPLTNAVEDDACVYMASMPSLTKQEHAALEFLHNFADLQADGQAWPRVLEQDTGYEDAAFMQLFADYISVAKVSSANMTQVRVTAQQESAHYAAAVALLNP